MLDHTWNTALSLELLLYKKGTDKLQQAKWSVTKMIKGWSTRHKGKLRELGVFVLEKRRLFCY